MYMWQPERRHATNGAREAERRKGGKKMRGAARVPETREFGLGAAAGNSSV
jgi:hypothetical protein